MAGGFSNRVTSVLTGFESPPATSVNCTPLQLSTANLCSARRALQTNEIRVKRGDLVLAWSSPATERASFAACASRRRSRWCSWAIIIDRLECMGGPPDLLSFCGSPSAVNDKVRAPGPVNHVI